MEFKQGIVLREALRTMRNSPVGYKPTVPFRETYGFYFSLRHFLPAIFFSDHALFHFLHRLLSAGRPRAFRADSIGRDE